MKSRQKIIVIVILLIFFPVCICLAGTSGKIAGKITDKTTGEPLIGATIIVVGTNLGAASDIDGHYTILEVPPGTYKVQVSYIGYRRFIVDDVRVFIDQTARLDITMESEAVQVGELVVVAERKIIKPDVATSVVAVSATEIKELPVSNVLGVVGLQAGIRDGNYRGGEGDRILFMLNGVTLRDPRNNQPTSSIALSAVKEISVERGGFNAEYGQVQNGIVNVVTREGSKNNYSGRFEIRYSPPAPKYWRGSTDILDIHDPMSYALRPFFDDAVCWTGTTNGAWDEYTRKQYAEFLGWNAVSKAFNTDSNPNNDLTPAGAQRAFEYELRKKQINNQPDYDIDAGFGGPVPLISEMLGDLRFYASYRSTREMLIFPLSRPDYKDYDATIQLNSDIAPGMKLRFSGLFGKQLTLRSNWDNTGFYNYLRRPDQVAGAASAINSSADLITLFSDFNFALSDISNRSLSAKFTHTINSKTFYDVSLETFRVAYNTRPSALRDTTQKYEVIPGFFEDSNPFGYWPEDIQGVLLFGGQHVSKPRDFTVVNATTLKADFTSQFNFQNLLKAGIELNYNDLNFDYGTIQSATAGKTYGSRVQKEVFPIRGSAYIQDKLETDDFIVNAGLRLDYSNSNDNWYDVDPFNSLFVTGKYNNSNVSTNKTKGQWQFSPRIGIAHPISENAKLFFNYGHFKQTPNYENMFRIARNQENSLTSIGNPNLILSKTISYELGFDFSINEEILLQFAAYYNDVSDQQNNTNVISAADGFQYTLTTANNYQDTRGFEFTIRKNAGRWFSGFANYTYQVTTSGNFGSSNVYDNIADQKRWDEATVNLYQNRPIPRPYARANINFFTPEDFGPEIFGHNILGGFMLNVLLDWQAGDWTTWNPKNLPAISNNVQSVDYFNTTLRFDKTFKVGRFNFDLFMDVNNVFNTLRLWNTGDQAYRQSLHFPKSNVYDNIPGDDKVGDYRKPGADYQPMEYQAFIDQTKTGKERAIYFEGSSGSYFEYTNGQWAPVEKTRIDKVIEDKAYIDMPNASTFWFLNPRRIFFGLRVSFNISD